MLIIKAKDGKTDTPCMVEIKGDYESVMNEYRAAIAATAEAILRPFSEDEKKVAKSEIARIYAECMGYLVKA